MFDKVSRKYLKMEISIIIINYNTAILTYNCVKSILAFTPKNLNFEIVLVDNASKFEDYKSLKANIEALNLSNITLFRSKINTGFSGGNMLGVQFATGKFFAFINSDVLLTCDSFSELITYFDIHKNVGVIGLQPIYENGNKQIPFSHFQTFQLSFLGYWLFEKVNPRKANRRGVYEKPIKVDFVVGSFMFFRAKSFNEIGGFDNNIFLYYEEMDVCQRLKKINLGAVFFPNINYIHLIGASTNLGYIKKIELKISHLYVVSKNNGYFSYLILKLLFIIEYSFKSIFKPKHFKMLYKLITFGPVLSSSLKNTQKILEK